MSESKFLLFLGNGFEDLEAATVIDVCGWTEYRDHLPHVTVTKTSFHEQVTGRFGLTIKSDIPFENINPNDYSALVIPGGFRSHGYDEVYVEPLYKLMYAIHSNGGTIATMCVGSLPVAKAGLLKGKSATTYPHSRHDNFAILSESGANVVDQPTVIDDNIISCAGPAQSIEVVFLLLENIIGEESTSELKRFLMYQK